MLASDFLRITQSARIKLSFGWLSLLIPFFIFLSSCKEEELDCDSIEFQIETVEVDLLEAVLTGNCVQIDKLFKKTISLFRTGKNCEYVTNRITSAGYPDVEAYVNYLNEERVRILDTLDC
ncbi:MAG: hypothetical protein ACK4RF_06220 [Cyclobacteriaceae bacterium]